MVEFARSLIADAVSDGMPTLRLPRMRIAVYGLVSARSTAWGPKSILNNNEPIVSASPAGQGYYNTDLSWLPQ